MTNCIHDHSQWQARWGEGDQTGAVGHLLGPETTLKAISMVERGRTLDLSHVIEVGAPYMAPNQTPYQMTSGATARNSMKVRAAMGATNKVGANLERIEMTTHVGTHVDSLGHFSIGDYLYGDHNINDSVGDFGLLDLGIENMPPVVTRGVLLDLSGLDGEAFLEAGRAVTKDDLQRAYDTAKIAPEAGDVVCLYTGWGRFYMTDNPRYLSGEPGIERGAAEWLTSQDAVAIGADNMAVEVLPGTKHPEIMMPVHQHCLAEAGVHLIENLALDELATEGIHEFCFVMLPVKFKGATGCPVRPVAMV